MSNFLSKVAPSSAKPTGVRAVIAGVEKVGKTTMACSAPRALLIPLESGHSGVNVQTTDMMETLDDYNALLDEIIIACQKGQFKFQSIVTDSATILERLIHDKTLQSDPAYKTNNAGKLTMESALGGYGKAYLYANDLFGKILSKYDLLATKGTINIVLTCHVFAGKVIDPTAGEYRTWDLLLHSPKNDKTYGKREMITQWSDVVGFLHEPIYINKTSDTLSMGISANKGRLMGLERTPGYVAGNRYGMVGEIQVGKEKSWNYLAHAIYQASGIDVFNKD